MRTSRSRIDRRLLYIPRPHDWNWEKLSKHEITDRFRLAQMTVKRLKQWEDAAYRDLTDRQQKLWAVLPEAKLALVQTQHAQIESLGKELRVIQRLRAQATKAVSDIWEGLQHIEVEEK